jgi:quinol monooxygenase YgiN
MALRFGFLARLEARPDTTSELATFLERGRELAVAEEGTVTWYAFRIDETTFGIFDTFETEAGRDAHLKGAIPQALAGAGPDLLAAEPEILPVEIVAVK